MSNLSPAPVNDASLTARGLINTTTQSFAGNKTFSGTLTASNITGVNSGDQTITLTGDVTGSGTGSFVATIASGAVTLAKLGSIATGSLLGRSTAGTGTPEVISIGAGLTLSGGVLAATASTDRITSALGAGSTDVVTRAGSTIADASVNSAAHLLSLRTGIGGTEVEKGYFNKDGSYFHNAGVGFGSNMFNQTAAGWIGYWPGNAELCLSNPNGAARLSLSMGTGVASATGVFYAGTSLNWGGIYANGGLYDADATHTRLDAHTSRSLNLTSPLAGASDTVVAVGSTTADGSVNAASKLLSVQTGIGGTPVEYMSLTKSGLTVVGGITANYTSIANYAINVKAYGAVGDGVTNDLPAFNAAITAAGVSSSGCTIEVPNAIYYLAGPLHINKSVVLQGPTPQRYGTASCQLKFPAGSDGVIIEASYAGTSGANAVLRNLTIVAAGKTTAAYGIRFLQTGTVEGCYISGWKTNGIIIDSTVGGSNCNSFTVRNCAVDGCDGDGVRVTGADSNQGVFQHVSSRSNGGWGFNDTSLTSGTYLHCHTETNGTGSYRLSNSGAGGALINCYAEGGQPAPEVHPPAVIVGGTWGTANPYDASIYASRVSPTYGLKLGGGGGANGSIVETPILGPNLTTTAALDLTVSFMYPFVAAHTIATATPVFSGGTAGQRVCLYNNTIYSITLQDNTVLAGSGLTLRTPTITLQPGDYIGFICLGGSTSWVETGRAIKNTTDFLRPEDYGARGDGTTDDSAALTATITAAAAQGKSVKFHAKTYLLSSEINLTSGSQFITFEGTDRGGSAYTTLKAGTLNQRSLFALAGGYKFRLINFDAARLAISCVRLHGASFTTFEDCTFGSALKDGLYATSTGINDNNSYIRCSFGSNGTIYYNSAGGGLQNLGENFDSLGMTVLSTGTCSVTSGSNIITGVSTSFNTMSLRPGDPVVVGTVGGGYERNTVFTVDSATQITCLTNFATTRATTGFAIGSGDGYHEDRSGDNNINYFLQGLVRLNAGNGMHFDGLYGPTVVGVQLDYWNGHGMQFGSVTSNPVLSSVVEKCYFEAHGGSMIKLISAQNIRISNCQDGGTRDTTIENVNSIGMYVGPSGMEGIGSYQNKLITPYVGVPWGAVQVTGSLTFNTGAGQITGSTIGRSWYSSAMSADCYVNTATDVTIDTIDNPGNQTEWITLTNRGPGTVTLVPGGNLVLRGSKRVLPPLYSIFLHKPGAAGSVFSWREIGCSAPQAEDVFTHNPIATPSTPAEGMVYYDSTAKQLLVWNGSVWTGKTDVLYGWNFGIKADGTTDDTVALQTAITAAIAQKKTLRLAAGVHKVTARIDIPGKLEMVGVDRDGGGGGTVIKAFASLPQMVLIEGGSFSHISGIEFEGNGLATIAVRLTNCSFSTFERCRFSNALRDGVRLSRYKLDNVTFGLSDTNHFIDCDGYRNGVLYATTTLAGALVGLGTRITAVSGTVSCTNGSNVVTGVGTSFTTLGLRTGDFIRIGTGATPQYLQIDTITDDTHITCGAKQNATQTLTGVEYAIGAGAGYFEEIAPDTNHNHITGGLWRSNAGAGIQVGGLYGALIEHSQVDTGPFYGISVGFSNISQVYNTQIVHPYFEGLVAAPIYFGGAIGVTVTQPMTLGSVPEYHLSSLTYNIGTWIGNNGIDPIGNAKSTMPTTAGLNFAGAGRFSLNPYWAILATPASTQIDSSGGNFAILNPNDGTDVTLSASPVISTGVTGQILTLYNGSPYNITLESRDARSTSLLELRTPKLVLAPKDTVTLQYYDNLSSWLEISRSTTERNGVSLVGGLGAVSTDIVAKVGTFVADATVHSSAHLLSVRTGIGGTEVEKAFIDKSGSLTLGGALTVNRFISDSGVSGFPMQFTSSSQGMQSDTTGSVGATAALFAFRNFGTNEAIVTGAGRIDQSGTDSTASPGNATINKPTGVSTLASGATTCVITNSLATTTSKILITWYGDLGTQTKIPWVTRASGSFTVNVGTAPGSNISFGWEVSNLL